MQYGAVGELTVSLLGLGTSRLASLGTRTSASDVARLLDTALDVGINFIDTADTYGSTSCERMLGAALARRPGRFHIATKGGYTLADLPGPLGSVNQLAKKAIQMAGRRQDFAATAISRRIDASLTRLGVATLDVYLLHEPPLAALRDGPLLDVLSRAVHAGKVRYVGVSSDDPAVLRAALEVGAYRVLQTAARGLRDMGAPFVGPGVPPVIANQALTGPGPGVRAAAERVAADGGMTVEQVLLRHAAANPAVRVVLARTANPAHLKADAAAFATEVTAADALAGCATVAALVTPTRMRDR